MASVADILAGASGESKPAPVKTLDAQNIQSKSKSGK